MFQRIGILLYFGIILVAASPFIVESAISGSDRPAACGPDILSELLHKELARGALGGVELETLAESTPHGRVCGAWESAVFDPDERCWYLVGWIDDERAGCTRLSLSLRPCPEGDCPCAWQFSLLCDSLVPGERNQAEFEGGWRRDGPDIRVVWSEARNGRNIADSPFVHVIETSRRVENRNVARFRQD